LFVIVHPGDHPCQMRGMPRLLRAALLVAAGQLRH
jgi:hypothetical protein